MIDSTDLSCSAPDLASFSFGIFALLSQKTTESNILISPFSIASTLALVLAGTTTDCIAQQQMKSVLGISNHSDLPSLSSAILKSSTEKQKPSVELISANGIWTTNIKPDFIGIAKTVHDAVAQALPTTYAPIDAFITEQTKGKISKMLDGPIDPLTVAVLVNAVYFKGNWEKAFEKEDTKKGIFYASSKNGTVKREAMMMNAERKMRVGTNIASLAGANAVLLEYGANEKSDAEFGALFLLPPEDSTESMDSLISALSSFKSSSSLGSVLDEDLFMDKVRLTIPRFRLSYGVKSMKAALETLGMKSAFNDDEMFLEMSNDPQVHIDDVFHKAVMEVTEEGTVAAAATVAVMMTRSLPRPPIDMNFDRPFIMMVLHLDTGTPLFISKVDDPEFIYS